MKIILINDVKKQGKNGDIINVKDGYGNFLINKGDAVLATESSLNKLDKKNKEAQELENLNIKDCENIKKQIEKITLVFKVKVGLQDKVFGTISQKQILEELKLKGINIEKKQIKINNSISTLGFHNVTIELHKKVIATLKLKLEK